MSHPVTEAVKLLRQEAEKWDAAPLIVRVRAALLRLAADRLEHWLADQGEAAAQASTTAFPPETV